MTETDYYANTTDLIGSDGLPLQDDPWWIVTLIFKSCIMFSIMVCAVFGNLLVIVSVFRHHRLRITTNFFVVSLAMADTLVALFAMTFNASYSMAGKWLFGQQVCDFWNSCDVLFSTASIMHLGCISLDRYYAIMKPLEYPTKITAKRVAALIAFVWVSSGLISFIPIFLGWYTTLEHMDWQRNNPDKCEFRVNKPYAIVSSSVSFWIPCVVMLFTYWKIYQEASRQEKWLFKTQVVPGTAVQNHLKNGSDGTTTGPGGHRGSNNDDPESGHSTPTKRSISKMKREHKAAKTLGIIMGAFILCWLPFFLWYVSISMCGEACYCPDVVVEILFWIGYFNSSLNPVIYAYFNKEFREAFKETLRNVFCRCVGHWQCLQEAPRENSNAMNHSSNARTTVINHSQEIGMVNKKQYKDDL